MSSDRERAADASDAAARQLPPDLALLLAALRAEMKAEISALKAWGVAMTLGGGFAGGVTATVLELARPGSIGQALSFILPV